MERPTASTQGFVGTGSQNFPLTRNDGIYNDRFIAKTKMKSLHAEGRALDIGLLASVPDEKLAGIQRFSTFIDNATLVGFQVVVQFEIHRGCGPLRVGG